MRTSRSDRRQGLTLIETVIALAAGLMLMGICLVMCHQGARQTKDLLDLEAGLGALTQAQATLGSLLGAAPVAAAIEVTDSSVALEVAQTMNDDGTITVRRVTTKLEPLPTDPPTFRLASDVPTVCGPFLDGQLSRSSTAAGEVVAVDLVARGTTRGVPTALRIQALVPSLAPYAALDGWIVH